MARKTTLSLHISLPDGSTQQLSSDAESVIVGSGSGAAIRIKDTSVSKLHCMFKIEKGGAVSVIDLGSEQGTWLQGHRVEEPTGVASGDVVSIGKSRLKVTYGSLTGAAIHDEVTVVAPQAGSPTQAMSTSRKTVPMMKALAGTGKNAAGLFSEPLPPESVPTETEKVLQVALLWGDTLISVQHFAQGVPVTIGESTGNHFTVFSVGSRFVLAEGKGSAVSVNVPADAGLVVISQNETHRSKDQLKAEGRLSASGSGGRADSVSLGLHDKAQVSFTDVAFIIRFVRPSAALTVNTFEEHDFTFFKIVSMSLMAFFALVAAMVLTPLGMGGDGDDIFANPSKYVKMVVKPEKKQEIKKIKDLSGVAEGAKAKEKEGKFGKQEAKKAEADPSKKGAPTVDVNKREEDRKKVSSLMAGMFGGGASSNVFGPGGLGTGINSALGGLQGGAGVGDAQGVGGLGSRGAGSGGGGTGLGLGGLGTKGGGRGRGGYGSIDLGGKGKDSTRVIPGKTTVIGGLDKDVIMKVIKRHQNEIKFCYEQELQKNPALAGKVAVAWTIDPSGGVSEATISESSISNANVESCVTQRIRRWKFPEPQGGGVVNVTFPWIFKAAGDDSDGE